MSAPQEHDGYNRVAEIIKRSKVLGILVDTRDPQMLRGACKKVFGQIKLERQIDVPQMVAGFIDRVPAHPFFQQGASLEDVHHALGTFVGLGYEIGRVEDVRLLRQGILENFQDINPGTINLQHILDFKGEHPFDTFVGIGIDLRNRQAPAFITATGEQEAGLVEEDPQSLQDRHYSARRSSSLSPLNLEGWLAEQKKLGGLN